ncbi:MAG: hypothetical protein Q4G04_04565 [bacterium]|nr:hypothetical protein [bacterium]
MKNNFTLSNDWSKAISIRYDIGSIVKIDDLYFVKKNNILECQHYFDFNLNSNILKELENIIKKGNIIKFKYIDDGKCLNKIKSWAKKRKMILNIIDEWEAPCLNISDIDKYFENNKTNQIKRNFKKYKSTLNNYKYVLSNISNVLDLWNDVLFIDYNSWKKDNNCDMKSLSREDLQYIFYLMNEPNNSSLNVCYKNNIPYSYSLLFRANSKSKWYAVKWGASKEGRIGYTGIFCLFDHLLKISKDKNINIDFWGRRSRAYDYLKNSEIHRLHIEVKKEV